MRRWLTLKILLSALIGLAACGAIGAWMLLPGALPLTPAGTAGVSDAALISRGRYLAAAGDCAACHTLPGGEPLAGGLGLNTPFGTIYAVNITPDRQTGIGGWSQEAFNRAMRRGVSRDGHFLYPAMPYNDYTRVSGADLRAIKAYLDTVPPVHRLNDSNRLPFPFNIRQMMLGWNFLFLDDTHFEDDPQHSAAWNRGRYLVDGLGHCAACHTAKNLLGGDNAYLQGGTLEGWYAPEITGDARLGLGRWSEAAIATYLGEGANAHAVASGPMAEAVGKSLQYLRRDDLLAIATYLKTVPGSGTTGPTPLQADEIGMRRGARIYTLNCSACHGPAGEGVPDMVPSFAKAAAVQAPVPANLIRAVMNGGRGIGTQANPTGAGMPGFAWKLDDRQIADVLTYLRNSFGNGAAAVDEHTVTAMRAKTNRTSK